LVGFLKASRARLEASSTRSQSGEYREGLNTDERAELVALLRELRTAKMENEILRRAAAYFAKETLPDPK
jgi:transposase-like protein